VTPDPAPTVVQRFASLRQHQGDGHRSPHKPLLALLALGRLASTGRSDLPWSEAESQLADLIAEFGRPSRTGRRQSAAYPFTRLRSDYVWVLDHDVPMDNVGPLAAEHVTGRFEHSVETALAGDPQLLNRVARSLVDSQFPSTIAADVLLSVGLSPEDVLGTGDAESEPLRRRDPRWRWQILTAWDRQCAFCGYDGQLAAHIRWFAFDGPDELDNGLALCSLHHKLFDLGVLGLDDRQRIRVSSAFTARTPAGRALYDLHGHELQPRPGTPLPALQHVRWHSTEVFKADPLVA
jgi:putative restriction endonuclease